MAYKEAVSLGTARQQNIGTHSSCDCMHESCADPSPVTPKPSVERGVGHEIPPPPKEPLVIVSCWGREGSLLQECDS